mmetsp:Transcript_10535/g.24455  ORF Transcript_10535/g.24455 Transcript_10535/m.24455 type:complete len:195 (-) Transcript_10535:2609-3193(-)
MNYLEDETSCTLIVFRDLGIESQDIPATSLPDLTQFHKWEVFLHRLEKFCGTSIACIKGFCSYFHFQLILACDYRVATFCSLFQAPEAQKGYLPGMSMFRLTKYTSVGITRRLLLDNQPWSAEKVFNAGIVDFLSTTSALACTINSIQSITQQVDSGVLANMRRLLHESSSTPYEEAIGNFLASQNVCLSKLTQ